MAATNSNSRGAVKTNVRDSGPHSALKANPDLDEKCKTLEELMAEREMRRACSSTQTASAICLAQESDVWDFSSSDIGQTAECVHVTPVITEESINLQFAVCSKHTVPPHAIKNVSALPVTIGSKPIYQSPKHSFSESWNEMLSAENSGLRDRVAELERKVQEQEDELVCLRSSMADVLRRLNLLETGPPSTKMMSQSMMVTPGVPINAANRALSRSTGNLRKNLSTGNSTTSLVSESLNATPQRKPQSDRRTASPGPRRSLGVNHYSTSTLPLTNGSVSPGQVRKISPRRTGSTRASVGSVTSHGVGVQMNGSMKKWVSSQDFNDASSNVSSLSPAGKPARRYGSQNCLMGSAASLRSLANIGYHKDPVFHSEDKMLQVFIRGRPINLLAPSTISSNYNVYSPNPPPNAKLKLEWVYGYRGRDCRSNLHLLPTGEILYFTATVAVLFNPDEKTQRHYQGHTDDIKCIAVHPNRLLIASGQSAKGGGIKNRKATTPTSPVNNESMDTVLEEADTLPHVRVWDSITLQTQHVLGIGDFERAVSCVAFSKSDGGNVLAVVDESYEHTLSLWDWQRRKKIGETKSANEQVFSVEFHPREKHLLVTCGKSQINFWTFDGVTLQKKMGVFEGRDKPKYVLCAAFTELGEIMSGDSNGTISVWDWKSGKVVKQATKAHSGGVFALCSVKGGRILSGGGRDRRLMEWTLDLKPTGRITEVSDAAGPLRTITQGKGSLVLVGTTHNAILHGSMDLGFPCIAQGHMDELWGVCSHPSQQQFLTCGYDKVLRLWDSISHSLIWLKEIADPARSLCFHPNGAVFCVGTTVGRWLVLDAATRDVVIGQKDGNDMISALEYSPNGDVLAVASQDGNVYIYNVGREGRQYQRMGKCGVHPCAVIALDWSIDGQFIRTNTAEHEVFYWYGVQCKPVASISVVRDAQWATDNCTLSFNTVGIWPDGADGREILSSSRNHENNLLVVSDEVGTIRLFSYPSTQPKSQCHTYTGHSCSVTGAQFLSNDSRLVSIGGRDSAIFQWSINKVL